MLWQRMAFATGERSIVVQTSQLSDNGMGPLPPGFENRPVSYPATFVTEHEFMNCLPGYWAAIRVPGTETAFGGLAVFGTVLLLVRN
jgi:hypothetical protein